MSVHDNPAAASVQEQRRGAVMVLRMVNPPVNGLGDSVRRGLASGLQRALDDAAVVAVVIAGEGRGFSGGADIRQFNTPAASAQPMLRQLIAAIEGAGKPVVAAIHGFALGGGLELAMGCHYRVADGSAVLGLPEVNLGLVPGGGGTQRLPRAVGVDAALEMVLEGKTVTAPQATEMGLVDALADGEILDFACRYALGKAAQAALPRLRDRTLAAQDLACVRARLSPRLRNAVAREAALACIEAAMQPDFEAGLDEERRHFDRLVQGSESKALRHLFFAEKEASRVAGRGRVAQVERVAIVGAGTMGGGIAMAFANAGIPVDLIEREPDALQRGMALIRKNYDITAAKGKLTATEVQARMSRIQPGLDLNAVAQADMIIEAVYEDMSIKQSLFRQLDALGKPGVILASNTSRLNIDDIAAVTRRPESVIGLHFFSPANVMKLLEVVRGAATAPDVIATSMAVARKIGKIPVLVGVCEGFVGNRMLTGYWREAGFLLEEGASPSQVDAAMKRFGMAMGPFAMADLAGMDINWATRKRLAPTRPAHLRYSRVADRICELGRFGQKTQAGYYRYEPGRREPQPDPVVDQIIAECAREAGIERRVVTDEEIVERCVLALVNEGARIIEEGIVQRASDVDVVYVHGYGFPGARGGPMFYAQTLGLDVTLEKIRALHVRHGEHWVAAGLLQQRVTQGASEF